LSFFLAAGGEILSAFARLVRSSRRTITVTAGVQNTVLESYKRFHELRKITVFRSFKQEYRGAAKTRIPGGINRSGASDWNASFTHASRRSENPRRGSIRSASRRIGKGTLSFPRRARLTVSGNRSPGVTPRLANSSVSSLQN
jgi:hypothetical protein